MISFNISLKGCFLPNSFADEKTLILKPQGRNYKHIDRSAPDLGRAVDEKIILTLPSNMNVRDLKRIWCMMYCVDFGNLIFHDSLDLPTSEKNLVDI